MINVCKNPLLASRLFVNGKLSLQRKQFSKNGPFPGSFQYLFALFKQH